MKKKLLAFLLVFCAFVLCGCSSPVEYSLYTDSQGQVYEVNYIPFSCSELRSLGVDEVVILQMQNRIVERIYSYYSNQRASFVNRVNLDPDLTDADKILLKSQYNKGMPDANIPVGATGDYAISVAGIDQNTNYIKIALKYESVVCYYMAKMNMSYTEMMKEVQKDDAEVVEGFGTNKKVNSGTSVFALMYDSERTLTEYVLNECTEILKANTNLTDEQILNILPSKFLYRFGTTSSRLRSNADNKTQAYDDNGGTIYFHEWTMQTGVNERGKLDLENKPIQTWTVHANKNVWYVLALASGLVVVGAMFVYDYFKNNKNKQEQPKVIDIN